MPVSVELMGSALVMGLAGSLHCIGMCGPLAFSLPVSHSSHWSKISGGATYNIGRIFSYTAMGLAFGSLGKLVIVTRWQSGLSIGLGIIILLYLLFPKKHFLRRNLFGHFSALTTLNKLFMLLRQQLGRLFQSKKLSSLFFIGVLNGFLPCGLIFLALTSSIISATPVSGGLFMLFFGLGTFPMMFATVLMGNYLNQSIRQKFHKTVPALLLFMALLLILRGMNLGIPFISPEFGGGQQHQVIECR